MNSLRSPSQCAARQGHVGTAPTFPHAIPLSLSDDVLKSIGICLRTPRRLVDVIKLLSSIIDEICCCSGGGHPRRYYRMRMRVPPSLPECVPRLEPSHIVGEVSGARLETRKARKLWDSGTNPLDILVDLQQLSGDFPTPIS